MTDRELDEILTARARATSAGPARARVETLLDAGSFAEYGVLADGGAAGAAGLVCGAGTVDGRPVVVASYDASVAGGAQNGLNHAKLERLLWLARSHRWPLVCWADGRGSPPARSSGISPGIGGGNAPFGLYDGLCELSGWSPTVAVVAGTAQAGHAAIAMLSDFVVATRGSTIGALGVEHHESTGDVDLVVEDEAAATDTVRAYLSYQFDLPSGAPSPSSESIGTIVPANRRRPYDMRRIVHAFADADSVLELRPRWGGSLVTCFARLEGRAIGIFANQPSSPIAGAIDSRAADKISRFVELCDAYGLPLVSFIDNPGYMVGPKAEREGIARHHARPLAALHHRSVPVYSVQVRKAYGLGPWAMSGWGSSRMVPDLKLAWPTVESGGMSLEGAAFLVRRREIRAAAGPEEVRAIQEDYARSMRETRSGLRAGKTFAFDDIVAPAETRDRIAAMLRVTPRERAREKTHYVDGI